MPANAVVTALLAAQTQLAAAQTAITAQAGGNPKTADQALKDAMAQLILAIKYNRQDDSQSQVPATP